MDRIFAYVKSRTTPVEIDSTVAELAGEINFTQKRTIKDWGMMDSFVYATARARGGKVLTGDPHFKDLRDVVYIGS
jgi:predicted nucleic acid-binding protein